MQKKKRSLLAVVLLAILALLVFPGWNPFLDEGQKQAVVSQLQKSFGGLFGGVGSLTLSRIISAASFWCLWQLLSLFICWLLELFSRKGRHAGPWAGLFTA